MGRVVIDRLSRGSRVLSADEERFAEWVKNGAEDLVALFETVYPSENDPDPFEPFDVATLCVEERLADGRIATQCLDMSGPDFPERWTHMEQLARMGLERVKETV